MNSLKILLFISFPSNLRNPKNPKFINSILFNHFTQQLIINLFDKITHHREVRSNEGGAIEECGETHGKRIQYDRF